MNAPLPRQWDSLRQNRGRRLERAASLGLDGKNGKEIPVDRIIDLLEAVIQPGDRVCLEGNNQKQADFLSESLADCSPERINHLSMVQSVLALPSHVDLFERGLANRLDFSFSGPQGARLAKLVQEQRIEIGAIHTYLELFGRYFMDLTPNVALIAAQAADAEGNLYLGPNTEDTPAIVEATANRYMLEFFDNIWNRGSSFTLFASIQLAESVGFRDSGAREVFLQAALRETR